MPQLALAALSGAASYFAANAASLLISTALSTVASAVLTPDAPSPQGQIVNLSLSTDAPRRVQIGKRGNGGVLADWFVDGHKNQNLYQVIYLGEGPMGNLTGIWAQGRKIYSSAIAHGQRVEMQDFRSPDARCYITYHDGRPGQTADSTLTAKGLGWTSAAVGTGCAYVMVEMIWDPDTMPFPASFMFESEGAKLYDRRLDSTAGGTGSHRHRDPSTWAVSSNPAVAADHYMLGRYLTALDVAPTMGIGLKASDVPYDRFAALANLCDENVTLKAGGTQKRYDANGLIHANKTHRGVLNDLGRAMNATPTNLDGLVTFIDREAKAPTLTIDEADLIEGIAEKYEPKNPWSELVNGVQGNYQDAANNYNPVPYPPYKNDTYRADDGGDEKLATLDLPFETSAERAQRHAFLHLENKRKQATLSGVYPLWTIELQEGDWFTRTGGRFGGGKTFEVVGAPLLDTKSLLVSINAREVDASNTAWSAATAIEPEAPAPNVMGPLTLPVANLSVAAFSYVKSPFEVPGLRFTNNDYADVLSTDIQLEVAASDNNTGNEGPTGEVFAATMFKGQQLSSITGLAPGADYVVRHRSVLGQRSSVWSDWAEYTTTGTYDAGGSAGGSVTWANVTGAGRPADNADVTADNTAAAITGQGWGATASETDAANTVAFDAAAAAGRNLIPPIYRGIGDFNRTAPALSDATDTGTGTENPYIGDSAVKFVHDQVFNRLVVYLSSASSTYNIHLEGGRKYLVVCDALFYQSSNHPDWYWYARLRRSDGTFFTGDQKTVAGKQVWEFDLTGESENSWNVSFWVRDLDQAATPMEFVPLAVGLYAQIGDSIEHPDLANDSFLDTLKLYGVEALADVTGSSTAAAIVGQGDQATANGDRGTTAGRPSSPPEGSWYADTTLNVLQFYTGGAWYTVANIAGANFTASYNGAWSNTSGSSSSFSIARSINTAGLAGSKTYLTQIVSSSNLVPKCSITSPTGVTPTLQASGFSVSETETGVLQTIVTDTATGATTTVQAGYTMTRTS